MLIFPALPIHYSTFHFFRNAIITCHLYIPNVLGQHCQYV